MFMSIANEYPPPPPPPDPDGFFTVAFFALVIVLLLATCTAVSAADAKHPCYAAPVQDCIDLIQHEGTPAYCAWAGAMAGYGAYLRELGIGEAELAHRIVMPRQPTAKEYTHIMAWLRFGFMTQKVPYEVGETAYRLCLLNQGALPDSMRKHNQGSF